MRHLLWLLPLVLLLSFPRSILSYDPTLLYKQQVIVILDNDFATQEAGQLLYQQHDTLSHVVMWNAKLQKLEQVEWNLEFERYEVVQGSNTNNPLRLPIGQQKFFSWSDTLITVVGNGERGGTTISDFSAEELVSLVIEDLTSSDVGRIDIIAGVPSDLRHTSPDFHSSAYLNQFLYGLAQLGMTRTSATLRFTVVMLDHSGREISGQLLLGVANETDIDWKHATPLDMWLGYFNGEDYHIEQTSTPAGNPNLNSPFFGILPEKVQVYVTDFQKKTLLSRPSSYVVTDNGAFDWVDSVAQKTYKATSKGRAPSVTRQVQLLSGSKKVVQKSIIEFAGMADFLKELRHYGDQGPSNRNTKVYYRFGDWVVSMNQTTFYVSVDGIITASTDSSIKTTKVQEILSHWLPIPDIYPSMQPNTNDDFFNDVSMWINGENSAIGLDRENAYNAQCGVAMFFSEAIRSFHIHISNMMSLDLVRHNYLTREYFFSSHPMARKGTWQIQNSKSGKKKTGLEMLQDHQARSGSLSDQTVQATFNEIIRRISRVTKSWLSHIDSTTVMGSRGPPPATRPEVYTGKAHQASLLSTLEDIGSTPPMSRDYLREYELKESHYRLLSSNASEPETGAVESQVLDFSHIDDVTLPLKASIALVNDHAYVSDLISKELYLKQQQTGKKYQVIPDSVEVEDQSDIVRFFVREIANVSSELEQITTFFDKSKLQSKALLEKLLSLSNKTKPIAKWIKKGDGVVNAIEGIDSSIHELESGNVIDILKGTYDLAHNVYKLGDITGINKAAGKYLGKVMKSLAAEAGESVEGALAKKVAGTAVSVVGEVEELSSELAPIIGAIMDIYNIYEDFHRHTTLGYIDGAFDIATTVLSLFGPEAAPFEAALSLIKMGIDFFYNDISKEIHSLPPDPSVGQIVVAVIKGIIEGIIDFLENIIDNLDPFAAIDSAHKLDEQYDKDQQFLRGMADYRNYFDVVKENGTNASEINFAGGQDSWNGGDITFHLGEDGHSTLSLRAVDSNGNDIQETHNIDTHGVEDIVLGIGESHSLSFKTVKVKFLWFIPVDSKRIISKVTDEKQTLHGTYYGNSQNNKFIAVQELPPKAKSDIHYNLEDYHYTLYGGGGNDSFYLGPQPTYVEGNEGSDAYFINSTATITEINSHSGDGQSDTMIINLNYSQLTARRNGLHLNLTSSNTHRIVILNWFLDVTHQRMLFKTGDGVVFKVSATITEEVELIAYALSGGSATQGQTYDARKTVFSEVFAISGSDHDDVLYGNDLDNQLNGNGGNDRLEGGEGRDTYHVDLNKGIDTINNFATGGEVDTLVIGTNLDQMIFSDREDTNDLYISHTEQSNTGAVIRNWFLNETYRHMIVVTEDKEVVKVSAVKNSTVSYQPLIVNMSHIEEEIVEPGDLYTRKFNLNSNQLYSEVTTVFGTEGNDLIIGNGKDNYITGCQGYDYIEGREGADTYVVKERDGQKTIVNCAKDSKVDLLLFAGKFDDIVLTNVSNSDLVLSGSAENEIEVILGKWFSGRECQHLLVRSADGITFGLPNTTESDAQPLTKTAKAIDNSNLTSFVELSLSGKWESVERVIGSQGNDSIVGNNLDNYLDPGQGNCYLEGGNGSDTYVIRSTYGEENLINNYAEDDHTDTILFLVPFLTIRTEIIGTDIQLSSLSGDGLVSVQIVNYNSEDHARHLIVTTSDGITFILPVANISSSSQDYKLIPVSINLAQVNTGQHMHLTAYPDFYEVRAVYGSIRYQNSIIGNAHNNTLVGGDKPDLLQGHEGDDILKGAGGNDVMEGGPGRDTLVGGDGDDSLDGGEDDDIISPGSGSNQVNGGPGTDTVIYSGEISSESGVNIDLSLGSCIHDGNVQDTLTSVENAYGTEFDDVLQGDDKDNSLVGQGGSDYLSPGSGYDILNGGNGNDTYDLAAANGTVTIENFAEDRVWDLVVMTYANLSEIWYEIIDKDVRIRVINSQYPVFYDGSKPAVVFKSFMLEPRYQHVNMEMADGSIVDLNAFINEKSGSKITYTSGLYVALALLLLTLCVLVSCVVLGVYKRRSKRKVKRYDQEPLISETDL